MSIVWNDLETSGLDAEKGSILEIAIVITDDDLNEIGEPFVSLVAPIEGRGIEDMDDYVRKMHTDNGLLAEIYEGAPSDAMVRGSVPHRFDVMRAAVAHLFAAFGKIIGLDNIAVEKALRKTPLAGSSIHFDRAWMHEHMRELPALLSHRMIDVSSNNEQAARWAPEVHSKRPGLDENGKPLPAHRALDDIRASIATARYYRDNVFGAKVTHV